MNGGHGVSRAVLSRTDDGLKACVKTTLAQLIP